MRNLLGYLLVLVCLLPMASITADPLAHTYSIVARDPETGNFGVAVQSHWFQVGPIVPWAAAGVGAVATQSFVKVDYGPRGLELMGVGKSARQTLDQLLAEDPQKDVRQVAMVDAGGRVAAWTGPKCIIAAGDQQGKSYSVQANLMDKDTVWPAMARAYEAAEGDLADRMLSALAAAEAEGGDIRGRQSAALIVVRAESTGKPWEDRNRRSAGRRSPKAAGGAAPPAQPPPRLRRDESRRRSGRRRKNRRGCSPLLARREARARHRRAPLLARRDSLLFRPRRGSLADLP